MELKIIDGLFETRAVDSERRAVDAVMSTDAIDRYMERIEHGAWKQRLSRFQSAPVLLKDHDHTKPIGHWENVRITDQGLVGTAIFATTPDGEERFALHRDGHVKSFSVGFIPHKWSYRDETVDGKSVRLKIYEDCELIECSSVSVGANPDALQRLMKTLSADNDQSSFDDRVEAAVERKLKQLLHAGPGGLMTTLAQDVAELVVAYSGQGVDDPFGDAPGSSHAELGLVDDSDTEDDTHHELNAALREVLGQ